MTDKQERNCLHTMSGIASCKHIVLDESGLAVGCCHPEKGELVPDEGVYEGGCVGYDFDSDQYLERVQAVITSLRNQRDAARANCIELMALVDDTVTNPDNDGSDLERFMNDKISWVEKAGLMRYIPGG